MVALPAPIGCAHGARVGHDAKVNATRSANCPKNFGQLPMLPPSARGLADSFPQIAGSTDGGTAPQARKPAGSGNPSGREALEPPKIFPQLSRHRLDN